MIPRRYFVAGCAVIAGISALSSLALAAPARKIALAGPNVQTGSVEALQEQLYKTKAPKKATQLKKAWDDLQAEHYTAAKKITAPLRDDAEYGDYARWIHSRASLGLAEIDLHAGKHAEAQKLAKESITTLSRILADYPFSPLVKPLPREMARAELVIGRALATEKKHAASLAAFDKAFQRLITSGETVYIRPADLVSYSEACTESNTDLCSTWIQRLIQLYPRNTAEYKAIAEHFPQYLKKAPKAPYFAKQTQSYKAPDLDQVSFDAAMTSYLDGKTVESQKLFRKFIDEFPRSTYRFRARYWLAQTLKKTHQEAEAKKMLIDLQQSSPLTYYGLLAAIDTGTDLNQLIQGTYPSAYDADPFLQPQEAVRLKRAKALLAAKAYDLAAIELKELRARDALSSPFLMYLAMLHSEAQSPSSAFPVLNDLINRGYSEAFSSFVSRLVFPLAHFPQIQRIAQGNRLDPVLALSLIKQESAFDAAAVSSSGALGLMQLMPATAADTMPGIERADLLNTDRNIQTGTKYLSQMMTRYQGNIALSLAAYNAGPGAVNRWVKASPPGRTMLEFIESIPFKETREYVASIIRNYYWYTFKLNPDQARKLKLDYFWTKLGPQMAAPEEENAAPAVSEENPTLAASPSPSPSPSSVAAPLMMEIAPQSTPSPKVQEVSYGPEPIATALPAVAITPSASPSAVMTPVPSASPSPTPSVSPSASPTHGPSKGTEHGKKKN